MERYDGNGRYHNAIIYNGLLFLSGQTATDVRDQDYVGAFNAAWDAWVNPETAPTRACMVTGLGRPAILVEVTVIAAVK